MGRESEVGGVSTALVTMNKHVLFLEILICVLDAKFLLVVSFFVSGFPESRIGLQAQARILEQYRKLTEPYPPVQQFHQR
jgi:hypothetical protein